MSDLRNLNYKQRLAAAWPDELPYGTPAARRTAATAPAAAPAAPAPEAPPFLELARAKGAAQYARALSEQAWPDDMSAVDKGKDVPDPEQARAQELAEIEQDLAVLNRRKERIIKTGQS